MERDIQYQINVGRIFAVAANATIHTLASGSKNPASYFREIY
jgi:hypothetical protein